VQGDTLSALAAAEAASTLGVPVFHVEAGLRSGDPMEPWPEEVFRRRISALATWHAAPTPPDRDHLLMEEISPERVRITGNTGIDALRFSLAKMEDTPIEVPVTPFIVMTLHRRENLEHRLPAMRTLLEQWSRRIGMDIVFPVHANPQASLWAKALDLPGVRIVPAMPYPSFIALLRACAMILSDSGGLQEEATWLQIPMYLLRQQTERHLALSRGAVFGYGVDSEQALAAIEQFLANGMARPIEPEIFGNGDASENIGDWLEELFLFRQI
jgi:UDP-N-acetylglucosamine 2-epimerase (non-hydrolysing)